MITPTSEFWKVFKETNGALSCAEAVSIMNLAALAPTGEKGIAIEAGTYHGKSAMAAAYGLKSIGEFWLVDPIFEDEVLAEQVSSKVLNAGESVYGVVCFEKSSVEVIPSFDKYVWAFVDSGDHQSLPMIEVKLFEDRIVQGGIIAFHDWQSQFLEVMYAYNYLLGTGKYEEVHINWQEIVEYINREGIEDGNKTWHHTELQNPCFVGALRKK